MRNIKVTTMEECPVCGGTGWIEKRLSEKETSCHRCYDCKEGWVYGTMDLEELKKELIEYAMTLVVLEAQKEDLP